jgi:hypothetical protein
MGVEIGPKVDIVLRAPKSAEELAQVLWIGVARDQVAIMNVESMILR